MNSRSGDGDEHPGWDILTLKSPYRIFFFDVDGVICNTRLLIGICSD